ncbi:MAG: preprotein translocase subunit SecG [Hyphomicrobiaceae bacterium]
MSTVLLLLHLLIAVAMIGVVLLQRSEGGGLGIGGGGSSFMTGRGTANLLTRATAALAAAFFATSIGLTLIARHGAAPVSKLDAPVSGPATSGDAAPKGGVLDSLEKGKQKLPSLPKSE